MELSELFKGLEYTVIQGNMAAVSVSGLQYDSRRIKPGEAFLCISGFKTDGHLYAQAAVLAGAVALVTERPLDIPGVVIVLVKDCRALMPYLASRFFAEPSKRLKLVGVTGTNGKTSVTHYIKAILEAWGKKTGIIGTLYSQIDEKTIPAHNTTPESIELEEFLSECVQKKAEYVVMEVSSHALDLNRVAGLSFQSAVFTNLTQDHLDYHLTMEAYLAAKAKLFTLIRADGFCVYNADDPAISVLQTVSRAPVITYGIRQKADIGVKSWISNTKGIDCCILAEGKTYPLHLQLLGEFNLYNALAALTWGYREGIPLTVILSALTELQGAPGRFEKVDAGQDFTVIVDYAHTPDGLSNVLLAARKLTDRRLMIVFGCGGDRDRTKRPVMGKIAQSLSDQVIVTSDNPRSEEPEAIIDEILQGMEPSDRLMVIPDRFSAIAAAVGSAESGDVILITGKGHEDYQILKDKTINFDDRLIVKQLLEQRMR